MNYNSIRMDEELITMASDIQNQLAQEGLTDEERVKLLNYLKLIFEMRKLNAEGDARSREADAKETEAEAKVKVAQAEVEKLQAEAKQTDAIDKNTIFGNLTLLGAIVMILKHEKLDVITTKAMSIIPHLIRRV